MPGLPEPDGAFDTAASVLDALRAGARVFAALDPDGSPLACLRAVDNDQAVHVGRISVHPACRGAGYVRLLLDAVGESAVARGLSTVSLDAVVERCLPPLYARLGFTVYDNWPSPDKPLSEVTMTRAVGGDRESFAFGWQAAKFTEHRAVVSWWLNGPLLVRVVVPAGGDVGADVRAGAASLVRFGACDGATLAGVDLAQRSAETVAYPAGRDHPEHRMPRTVHPDHLAIWRPLPGHEIPIDVIETGETR